MTVIGGENTARERARQ